MPVCFSNNGKFNRFECFRKDQTDELAGLIIWQIKQFVLVNKNISRLIIHFYKNMSEKELEPIEEGLHSLGLDIPVYVVSINKTESHEITVFDDNRPGLMPLSGTIIKIDFNRYLLFNNTRYKVNGFNKNDGYPFPIKHCLHRKGDGNRFCIRYDPHRPDLPVQPHVLEIRPPAKSPRYN